MKKEKIRTLASYIGVGMLAIIAGCDKFLDVTPDMRTQIDSRSKLAEMLVSAYPKSEYISFTEFRSDNVEDKGVSADYYNVGSGLVWEDNFFWRDSENAHAIQGSTDRYWAECYMAIAAANTALQYINQNPNDASLLPYRGEALVARAYAHFMLVSLYSQTYRPNGDNSAPGIPYLTEPENVVIGIYSRGTVSQTYARIEEDLLEGLPLIDNTIFATAPKFHFTREAALAFATRFYLFYGKYQEAINQAGLLFSSREEYRANLRPWNTTYLNSPAAVFQLDFTRSNQASNLLLSECSAWLERNSFIRYGLGPVYITTMLNSSNNILGKGMTTYRNFNRSPWYSIRKFEEFFVETRIGSGIGHGHNMIPLLTVDETLINRAEAYAASGQVEEALADLNVFLSTRVPQYNPATDQITATRVSNYYPDVSLQRGVIEAILYYKQLEFTSEGLRWFDLNRHQITVRHLHLDQNRVPSFEELLPDDPRRVIQIPATAVRAGLELNPR